MGVTIYILFQMENLNLELLKKHKFRRRTHLSLDYQYNRLE
jgi:hypothetical protein